MLMRQNEYLWNKGLTKSKWKTYADDKINAPQKFKLDLEYEMMAFLKTWKSDKNGIP